MQGREAKLNFCGIMKHESIVVVYDSCQAIAEEIADKLGAETVSVQSMNVRQIENSQSLVLAVEFQDGGNLSPHWQYAIQMFRGASRRYGGSWQQARQWHLCRCFLSRTQGERCTHCRRLSLCRCFDMRPQSLDLWSL